MDVDELVVTTTGETRANIAALFRRVFELWSWYTYVSSTMMATVALTEPIRKAKVHHIACVPTCWRRRRWASYIDPS